MALAASSVVSSPVVNDETVFEYLRDEMTRIRLARAVAHLPGLEVIGFDSDWWDGQTHAPCLVIRGGRGRRRQRVVETSGEAVVVPFAKRAAERWLAERRKPRRIELVAPSPRTAADLVIVDASADALRCGSPNCGALLPIDYSGACPICGR